MSTITLSVQDVVVLVKQAQGTKERTRSEAYSLLARTDNRLKAAAEGQLALEPAVTLPLDAVVRVLWKVRKVALAQWKAAKAAAEAEPAEVSAEAQFEADLAEWLQA
jgi:hypothetical protein